MKLANFAAIDPNHMGRGMTSVGNLDVEVWNRYASDEDALAELSSLIREKGRLPAVQVAEPTRTRVAEVEVEAQHVEQFQIHVRGQAVEAARREQSLVLAYSHHLKSLDRRVTRHRYQLRGSVPPLVCDIVDETEHVLFEAKGDVRRTSVRMAIGQLLDYRRFEPPWMKVAILLPRQPGSRYHPVDSLGSRMGCLADQRWFRMRPATVCSHLGVWRGCGPGTKD